MANTTAAASAAANPYATAAIGATSAVGGAITAAMSADDKAAYYKALQSGETDLANSIAQKAQGEQTQLSSLYSPVTQGYAQNAQNYYNDANNADFSQFNLASESPYTGFSTENQTANTQALLNPETSAMEDAATKGVEQSAANSGKLFSGAAGKQIAQTIAPIEAQQWNTAAGQAQQLGQNQYQSYLNQFQQAEQVANFNKGNFQSGLNNQQTAVQAQSQPWNAQTSGTMGITNSADQAQLQAQQTGMQAGAQLAGTPTGWDAAIQGGLGALTSAL